MRFWRRESANFLVGAIVVLLVAVGGWFIWTHLPAKTMVRIESAAYQVDIAYTADERDNNLRDVKEIGVNGGLLLVYPRSDRWKISMENIMPRIDIIWMDESHKVVYIVRDAEQSEERNVTFVPTQKALYVLEVPAGSAKRSGVKVGSVAVLNIDEERIK